MNNENLSKLIEHYLSPEYLKILDIVTDTASSIDMKVYLVGGIVRDILLKRDSFDLDIVVEGDAIELSYEFAELIQAKVTVHPRFRTATVKWDDQSVDLVTARSETYSKPGALPTVRPGTIEDDLARRDFTVNAMAVDLSPEGYGYLTDPFNGQNDLKKRLVRILHEKSFIDDATRIWRAVRYEQRLDFSIEPKTLSLLKTNITMLDTISRDRIRHELELVLNEAVPEKALIRAGELGILQTLHKALKADTWLAEKYLKARETGISSIESYLALLACRMNEAQIKEFSDNLNLRKKQAGIFTEIIRLKSRLRELSSPDSKPSVLYEILKDCSKTALTVMSIAEDDPNVRSNISLYTEKLSKIKPALTGKDLRDMGISSGREIKDILQQLLVARLDGTVASRQEEIEMVTTSRENKQPS